MEQTVALVAVSAANYTIDRPYSYRIAPPLSGKLQPGMRVIVPFGRSNRKVEGLVLRLTDKGDLDKMKAIESAIDDRPLLSGELVRLALWMRDQYFCTVYDAIKPMLPAGVWYRLEPVYRIAPEQDPIAAEALTQSELELQILRAAASADIKRSALSFDAPPEEIDAALAALVERGLLSKEVSPVRALGDKTITLVRLAVSAEAAAEFIEEKRRKAPASTAVMEFLLSAGEAAVGEITYYTGCKQHTVKRLSEQGLVSLTEQEVFRRPNLELLPEHMLPKELSPEQQTAADALIALADDPQPRAALLFGVTGSGKTQVYLSLVEHVLAQGRTAMVLVPEIALTPQLMRIFYGRFGDRIAILHSALSAGQRLDEWKRVESGAAPLVLGTRSAVFAPIISPGLIITDEEQEGSYKSEQPPRYHARDIARYRIAHSNGLLLLGSATPALESFYAAKTGRYQLLRLDTRYGERALPEVITVDLREELLCSNPSTISRRLAEELQKNIAAGQQSILLLNRRGNAKQIVCGACGHLPQCPNCSVALTWHSANRRLMCHYCGTSRPAPPVCPECGGQFKLVGAGTQRCEEDLQALFPDVPVLRMDSDATSARHSHEAILQRFHEENIPILLGTQMVAKGLDFERVTLVGVINADQSLYADDYRAHERTFSLITQVIGRAGRGKTPGRAVLQTYTPDNSILAAAAAQDYERFYAEEIELRRRLDYPPFRDLLSLTVSGLNENGTMKAAFEARELLRAALGGMEAQILGPAQAALFRRNSRYRYRLYISCISNKELLATVGLVLKQFRGNRLFRQYAIQADPNPSEF